MAKKYKLEQKRQWLQYREQGKSEMNEFRNYVIAKIKGDHIKKIQIHGIVGENDRWDFNHTPMLEIEFRDSQMMGEGIFTDRRHTGKDNNEDNQERQPHKKEYFEVQSSTRPFLF